MANTRSASAAASNGDKAPSPSTSPVPTNPKTASSGPPQSEPGPSIDPITNSPNGRVLPKPTSNGTLYAWAHVPSQLTLLWLAVSLPLVCWDTVYVLLRPWTMEGGHLHWPFYVPYKLYGEVDHVYGWKAFDAKMGFTSAQGTLNCVETAMYAYYLWLLWGEKWRAGGRKGAVTVLVGFAAAVMTLSKTVLYWAHEYFGGFDNIGHNAPMQLIFLWIIPNGAWLIGSTWMVVEFGENIIDGLTIASSHIKHE